MVMVERWLELDTWCLRRIYSIFVCYCSYFSTIIFHRIYAAYGGIFIVMSLLWGWLFQEVPADLYDIIGASIALVGVIIIFYAPRKGEQIWTK